MVAYRRTASPEIDSSTPMLVKILLRGEH